MKVFLDDRETYLSNDPQQRPVRVFNFVCPCGKQIYLFCTGLPHFNVPPTEVQLKAGNKIGINVWHYDLSADGKRVSLSPSIGLHELKDHTPACHLVITDAECEAMRTQGQFGG